MYRDNAKKEDPTNKALKQVNWWMYVAIAANVLISIFNISLGNTVQAATNLLVALSLTLFHIRHRRKWRALTEADPSIDEVAGQLYGKSDAKTVIRGQNITFSEPADTVAKRCRRCGHPRRELHTNWCVKCNFTDQQDAFVAFRRS